MGRVRGTNGREEECIQNYDGKPEERANQEDIDAEIKVILKWILEEQDLVV
jgi:hypothetical protein